jgi:hypothetical protein
MTSLFNSLPLTQKRLLILLQHSLWAKTVDINHFEGVSHNEWKELMELAAVQGVFGLAYDGLKGLPDSFHPPRELLIQWALGVKQIEKRHYLQVKAIQSLAALYKENGIRCLLLKGIGISQLYPIPEHRESGDIDVYLFGDYARGNQLIMDKGIKVEFLSDKHSKFEFDHIPVENHFSLLQIDGHHENLEFERILLDTITYDLPKLSEELRVFLPPLSFNLLFLHKHAITHFLNQGIVLRHLCDWALLIQSIDEDDYSIFYKTIKHFDLQRYAQVFNYIAVQGLGLQENKHIPVNQDYTFINKVFSDIMNQKRLYPYPLKISRIQIFKRKLKSSFFFLQSRWKYDAINRKVFLLEFVFRINNLRQIFKINR